MDTCEGGTSMTRKDSQSAVKQLYGVLECINDLLDMSQPPRVEKQVFLGSDIDLTEASNTARQLIEIEESKDDAASV